MNKTFPLSLPSDGFDTEVAFKGDALGREAIAVRLTSYIDRLKAGAVLGVDAPWGEGKTWFGRHWAKQLEATHKVAYIDAFEHDYVGEPFVLIASELANLLVEDGEQRSEFKKKAGAAFKALLPTVGKMAVNLFGRLAVGSVDLSGEIGEAVESATEGIAEGTEKWVASRIEEFDAERSSLRGFRDALAVVAAKQEHPVVVFVDELDRCKPSFAVALIERLKHLFDVPNLVFVLLINRRQLEVAIVGQYGQGTDGQGYLGKFVNLWFSLPLAAPASGGAVPALQRYLAIALSKYGVEDSLAESHQEVRADMVYWASTFGMSLREIDRMCALFVLADYGYSALLIYLCALKVKHTELLAGLRRRAHSAHQTCVDRLRPMIAGKHPRHLNYEEEIAQCLIELHQLASGEKTADNVSILNRNELRVLGAGNIPLSQAFPRILALIDLPVDVL